MGQSTKTRVLVMGLSKELRLLARSRSYRVQVRGQPSVAARKYNPTFQWSRENIMWHDVQIIPRTQRRDDIPWEKDTAYSAFRRREQELQDMIHRLATVDRLSIINNIINGVVISGKYKGSQTWGAILSECNRRFSRKQKPFWWKN